MTVPLGLGHTELSGVCLYTTKDWCDCTIAWVSVTLVGLVCVYTQSVVCGLCLIRLDIGQA